MGMRGEGEDKGEERGGGGGERGEERRGGGEGGRGGVQA